MTIDARPAPADGLARLFGRVDRLFGAAAIVCGCVLLLISAAWSARTASWIATTARAQGSVVAHRNQPRTRPTRPPRGVSWAEVVRFTDAAGIEREFVSALSTPSPFPVGGAVPVRYRSADPSDAEIDTWFRTWGLPTVFAAGGTLFVVAGIALRRGRGARNRAGRP